MQSTQPDIQFAVHQCARFSEDPKKSHEVAAKQIVRYLSRTKDQGIILKPNKKLGLLLPGSGTQYQEICKVLFDSTSFILVCWSCKLIESLPLTKSSIFVS